jgi:colanic acid/amylovoran biosynthesis glycosyltransferase
MSKKPLLLLFTCSYPYTEGAEETFLTPALESLAVNFRIIIFPASRKNGRVNLPEQIEVGGDFAADMENAGITRKIIRRLSALKSALLYRELIRRPESRRGLAGLKRTLLFMTEALRVKNWIINFIRQNKLDLENTLFCTYWFNPVSFGIGLAKSDYPGIKLVSRAHGYDLYEERYCPPYIPFRTEALARLDKLFIVSQNGVEYLAEKYPQFAGKYSLSRLGINDPGFMAKSSEDGIFRVVSCSMVISVKRIELLLLGLFELAKARPDKKIIWSHFGDGPLLSQVKGKAKVRIPDNMTCSFLGKVANSDVMSFYRQNPIDAFVNVSSSEGISVAIMEAQSCGIPVIATAVGGTPEIVGEDNGILLNADPTPAEIARAFCCLLDDPGQANIKRQASRRNWEAKYRADANYRDHASQLRAVLLGEQR